MSDLVDGQFNVLGKTIRVIEKSNESINLLRKTALSSMGKDFLNKMFTDLSKSVTDVGIEIPDIELEIKGPVIQVIPIAIFS